MGSPFSDTVRSIAGFGVAAGANISRLVLSVTDRIGAQLHISSKWASRGGFIVLWGAGMTFIQVDEYGLALIAWILSAVVLFSKGIHWQGLANHPARTRVLRVLFISAAILFVPISVIWTQSKRGDKAWTAFRWRKSSSALLHVSGCNIEPHTKPLTAFPRPADAPDSMLLSESLLIGRGILQLATIHINALRKASNPVGPTQLSDDTECSLLQEWESNLRIPAIEIQEAMLQRVPIEQRIPSQTNRVRFAYRHPKDVGTLLDIVSDDLLRLSTALEKEKHIEGRLPEQAMDSFAGI